MQEKYSIAVFGVGIVAGLLLTEQRRVFADKWIWLGGLAALLVFLPNSCGMLTTLAVRRINAQHQGRGVAMLCWEHCRTSSSRRCWSFL